MVKIFHLKEDGRRLSKVLSYLREQQGVYQFCPIDETTNPQFSELPQIELLKSNNELYRQSLMWFTLSKSEGWFLTKPVDPAALHNLIMIESKRQHKTLFIIKDGRIDTSVVYSKETSPIAKIMLSFYQRSNFCINPSEDITRNLEYVGVTLKDGFLHDETGIVESVKEDLTPESSYKKDLDCCILIPVYNAELYIKECLDSVLSQDTEYTYKVLVADDGSVDKTVEIIKGYQDSRIQLIENKDHKGISTVLNQLLKKATDKGTRYWIRMDADDIMLINRIQHQVTLMDDNPDIDLLGSGRIFMKDRKVQGNAGQFQPIHFIKGNVLIHPTLILRASTCNTLKYSEDYPYAEDFELYYSAIKQGLSVVGEPTPVIEYRSYSEENDSKLRWQQWSTGEIISLFKNLMNKGVRSKSVDLSFLPSQYKTLTAIITFKNEGDEIEKTVKSIRSTTKNVEIILVDDASEDNYDYKRVAEEYRCTLIRNKQGVGVAGSRNLGVNACKTNYFVLLDGHMRFYDKDWDRRLVRVLQENPDSIVTSNTVVMTRRQDGTIENEDGSTGRDKFGTFAAVINPDEPCFELTAKWTSKTYGEGPVVECSAVMGAVYASSKSWWNYILGLNGLIQYGNDEALMSIKTWLLGGKCLLMKNWGVGHLYRENKPYLDIAGMSQYNKLFLVELFIDDIRKKEKIYDEYKKTTDPGIFTSVINKLADNYPQIRQQREYINSHKVMSLQQFLSSVNSKYL